MRVNIPATGFYTYPDLVVTCEKPRFEDKELDTLLNPQVIIEVVSDSTEAYDRGRRFKQYMQIESLRDYILVSQTYASLDHCMRDEQGNWSIRAVNGLDAELGIPTIGCTLRLADIYAKVEFPPESEVNRAAGIFTDEELR